MRVLQLVYAFYPPYSESGNSRVAYEISKGLARRGHDVTVCTTNVLAGEKTFEPKKKEYEIEGIKVHYHKNLIYKPHTLVPILYSQGVIGEIRKDIPNYDVIHLHENRFYTSILLHHYAKKYGIPYVLQAHGDLPRIPKHSLKMLFDVFFGYRLLRDAAKVIALNHIEAEQYKSMGIPDEKIAIIPNGIDLSEYDDLPPEGSFKKEFEIKDTEKIVLYLGRIHESKGLGLLAKAFSFITKDLDSVRLVVIGPDDGYLASFLNAISDLGLEEKVLLPGLVSKEVKFAALVDSDVFVTPRFSGFPIVFLEACLAGCPIVTASNELDWIHNNVGYVAKSSPVSIANAVLSILQNEGLQEKFRNNCRRAVENFDVSKIVPQLENIYKEIAL